MLAVEIPGLTDVLSGQPPLTRDNSAGTPLLPLSALCDTIRAVAQLCAGMKFYTYQNQVSNALIEAVLLHEGDTLTILQARQSGKTEAVAATLFAMSLMLPLLAEGLPEDWRLNLTDEEGRYRGFKNGIRTGVYGPSGDIVMIPADKIARYLNSPVVHQLLAEMQVEVNKISGGGYFLSNGSSILFRTAERRAKKEGYTYDLLIIEECQDVDSTVIVKSLHPFVSSTNGTIVKIGTASSQVCDFYTTIQQNKRLQTLPDARPIHFQFDWEACARENSMYRQYVEKEKKRLGEESDAFMMSYCCMFILERGMFITEKDLMKPDVALTTGQFSFIWPHDLRRHGSPYSLCAGIDFGKAHDSTILTIIAVDWENPLIDTRVAGSNGVFRYQGFKKHVLAWSEWRGDNYEKQFAEIHETLNKFLEEGRLRGFMGDKFEKICVDATGLGVVACDRLSALLPWKVIPFKFSKPSKSDGYKVLSADLLSGRLTFPADDRARQTRLWKMFQYQMLDLRKEWRDGYMMVRHEDSKHSHDDAPDSLMLANWVCNQTVQRITVDSVNLFSPSAMADYAEMHWS